MKAGLPTTTELLDRTKYASVQPTKSTLSTIPHGRFPGNKLPLYRSVPLVTLGIGRTTSYRYYQEQITTLLSRKLLLIVAVIFLERDKIFLDQPVNVPIAKL